MHARGMGDVYRAHDGQRSLAVKIYAPRWVRDLEATERFLSQVRVGGALGHPALLPPCETGRLASGRAYVTSPWIAGKDLGQILSRGALDPRLAAELLAPIASALDALHGIGIVHRTLSAAKIRLTLEPHPRIVLTGHGSAPLLSAEDVPTSPASLDYVAPEAELDEADQRVDVYALAILAFRMIAGAFPFPAHGSAAQALSDRQNGEAPALSRVAKRPLPRDLQEVVRRGLARHPDHRYASAGGFVADLRDALGLPRATNAADPVIEALLSEEEEKVSATPIAVRTLGEESAPLASSAMAETRATAFHLGGGERPFWFALFALVTLVVTAFVLLVR